MPPSDFSVFYNSILQPSGGAPSRQALDLGLVDELGDFDVTVKRALKIAHLKSANLVEYRERYDLSNFLSLFGESGQAHDIKLDLGVEAPKLRTGLMYFLYQP